MAQDGRVMKASLVKQLGGTVGMGAFIGDKNLYRLEPPYQGHEYVTADSFGNPFNPSGGETWVHIADSEGNRNWEHEQRVVWHNGNHSEVLASMGYELA